MKQLTRADLEQLLTRIAEDYHLLTPQRLADGSRLLRPWSEGELSLSGEPVQRKPTEYFLPQHDPLVTIDQAGNVKPSKRTGNPLCLFGLNRADLQCLNFVDRFCAAPPQDDAYFDRRSNTLLIGLTGYSGPDHQLLPIAEELCDIELVATKKGWLACAFSEQAEAFLEPFILAEPHALENIAKLS